MAAQSQNHAPCAADDRLKDFQDLVSVHRVGASPFLKGFSIQTLRFHTTTFNQKTAMITVNPSSPSTSRTPKPQRHPLSRLIPQLPCLLSLSSALRHRWSRSSVPCPERSSLSPPPEPASSGPLKTLLPSSSAFEFACRGVAARVSEWSSWASPTCRQSRCS